MHCKSYSHFFSKKFQHICVSLDVNFNESLTNDIVSFEQLGPEHLWNGVLLRAAIGQYHCLPYVNELGPVVQSVVSLTSSLRVISLTVLADSIYNILIFLAEKNVSSFCIAKATHIFSAKNFSIFAYHSM